MFRLAARRRARIRVRRRCCYCSGVGDNLSLDVSREVVSGSVLCLLRSRCRHGLCCDEHRTGAREARQHQCGGPYCGRARHVCDYLLVLEVLSISTVSEAPGFRGLRLSATGFCKWFWKTYCQGRLKRVYLTKVKDGKEWTCVLSAVCEKCAGSRRD